MPAAVKLGKTAANSILLKKRYLNPAFVAHFDKQTPDYKFDVYTTWSRTPLSVVAVTGPIDKKDSFFSELQQYDPNYSNCPVSFKYKESGLKEVHRDDQFKFDYPYSVDPSRASR